MNDDKILELYFNRSERAITETSDKYGRYCHFIAFNILHNDFDSEECVNDTYMKLWNLIPPSKPDKFQTFIGKITRNLALKRYEKLSAEKRGGGQTELVIDELSEILSDNRAEDILDKLVVKETLNKFLNSLPADKRKIFVRRYWYMDSIKNISDEYKLSESNVKTTLFRLREQLKEYFEREGVSI